MVFFAWSKDDLQGSVGCALSIAGLAGAWGILVLHINLSLVHHFAGSLRAHIEPASNEHDE